MKPAHANAKAYPPDSAGRIANGSVPVAQSGWTIREVIAHLRKNIHGYESINYIYALDRQGRLSGVISIKDTLRQEPDSTLRSVMARELVKVHPFTHQEKVAYLALRHNLKALPVVGKDGKFIGAVLSDTILAVLQHEMQRDIANIAGVPGLGGKSLAEMPFKQALSHRLPWLVYGLLGIIGAAKIIGFFEDTLADNLILASFIPLMMYMGGSTLSQSQSFFIRDLALSADFRFARYFYKQAALTAMIAFILSALALAVNLAIVGDLRLSVVISASLFAVLCLTTATSLVVPYLFILFKKDPADGSGPISTIFQDVFGVVIFFLIATLLL